MSSRGAARSSWFPLFLGCFLAHCSVSLDDLSNGVRDKPGEGGLGDGGARGGASGSAGSVTAGAAGSGARGGAAGWAGSGAADLDAAGAAGSDGEAGSGGVTGTGGATGSGGTTGGTAPDATAGGTGMDVSDDHGGGFAGHAGAAGSGGASGAEAGTDAVIADGGANDVSRDGPASDAGALCRGGICKRVFVTIDPPPTGGNLGGLAGADDFCQARADTNQLGGTWKAWLSDATSSASARLAHATVPYVLLDGTTVAANWSALTGGTLAHAIDVGEDGDVQPGMLEVWTGSTPSGGYSGRSCSSWRNNASGSATADVGYSSEASADWTDVFQQYCDRLNVHLYCFEQ